MNARDVDSGPVKHATLGAEVILHIHNDHDGHYGIWLHRFGSPGGSRAFAISLAKDWNVLLIGANMQMESLYGWFNNRWGPSGGEGATSDRLSSLGYALAANMEPQAAAEIARRGAQRVAAALENV